MKNVRVRDAAAAHMRKAPRGAVMAAALGVGLGLTGCIGDIPNPPLVQPGAPVGQITVRNATEQTVNEVSIATCEQLSQRFGHYDGDRLGDRVLRPGESQVFAVSHGCYMLRAMTGGGGFFGSALERFTSRIINADQPEGVWGVTL